MLAHVRGVVVLVAGQQSLKLTIIRNTLFSFPPLCDAAAAGRGAARLPGDSGPVHGPPEPCSSVQGALEGREDTGRRAAEHDERRAAPGVPPATVGQVGRAAV